jgi:CheY-like chemotaxis protein
LPGGARLPVVLMVNEFAREPVAQAASEAGLSACVAKPVNPPQLLGALLGALGVEGAGLAAATPPPAAPSAAAQHIAGAQVLVVDDNVINQQVAREVLLRAGVHVALAGTGADAVRMVDQAGYDAVLMDIQMPGMDGYEATARIRAKAQHARLPVIAMTAHAVAGFRESSLAMGMNDYVTKPIDPERLFKVLAGWIRRDPARVAAVAPAPPSVVAAVVAAPPPVPGIDMAAALERLGGNRALLAVLLDRFVADFEAGPQRLLAAIEAGDFDQAAMLVHKIRGAAGNLSMPELHRAASELEQVLQSSEPARLDEPVAAFGAALETVVDGVQLLNRAALIQIAPVSP